MRKFKALLLCVILAVSLIGSGPAERVVGQALTKNSGWTQDSEEPEPVEEMTELRTASSKTYKLTNGSYRYVAYAGPIHYLDSDGKYREIDTSLVASRDSDFLYTNAANSWNVSFGENEIKLTIDGQSIVFSLPECSASSVKLASDVTDRKSKYFEEKTNEDNAIVYSYNGFDVVYSVLTGSLQEDIVISDRDALRDFSFTIRLSEGLKISDREDLKITDRNDEVVFRFTQPYMYDANGNISGAVDLDYAITDEDITVSIRPDNSFFNEDTEYPVIIVPRSSLDPTNATQDTCVDEGYPNLNYYAQSLWTGGAAGVNRKRTFIHFNLPSSINANQVTRARIRLKKMTGYAIPNINAFAIDQTWNDSSVTWNDQPTYITGYWSPASVSEGNDWYSVDVTEMICYYMVNSNWYYGFVLKEIQESNSDQKTKFYSSEAAAGNRPELCVDFVNSLGSRPYTENTSPLIDSMGYALEIPTSFAPYELEIFHDYVEGKTTNQILMVFKECLEDWMDGTDGINGEYQQISSYDADISTSPPGWYRVAIRVGLNDINNNGICDANEMWSFQWWVQTSSIHGTWAKKTDNVSSLIAGSNGRNPATFNWNWSWYNYSSDCLYYQIKDLRSID